MKIAHKPTQETSWTLIIFDNIQPEAEALSYLLNDERIKIIIFINAKQKLSVDRVKALQPFGGRVDYIEMSGSGKNALDFIIAFYIGRTWNENPAAKLYLISQDTGFDPLLKHLTAIRPESVKRVTDLMKIKKHTGILANSSEPPPAQPGKLRQRATDICAALLALPEGHLPDSAVALENFIKSSLNDSDMLEQHIAGLLNFMIRKELMVIDDGGLKYQLENISAGAEGQFMKKPANHAP